MKAKAIFKNLCGAMFILSLASCGCSIEGQWVEPVPGMEDMVQGISLEKGGKASSINMATLQYERWEQNGKQLVLSGKSIGNGITIPFSDTLTIVELSCNNLFLKQGKQTISYRKQ